MPSRLSLDHACERSLIDGSSHAPCEPIAMAASLSPAKLRRDARDVEQRERALRVERGHRGRRAVEHLEAHLPARRRSAR